MSVTSDEIRKVLARLELPDGGDLVSRDMIRALSVDGGRVRFVIEAPDPARAQRMEPMRAAAEAAVAALPGVVRKPAWYLTAHSPASGCQPRSAASPP